MTEEEWLTCYEPRRIMRFFAGEASTRKLRLFACACCRRVWSLLTDERSRNAVEVAERFADRQATESERASAFAATSGLDWQITREEGDGDSAREMANCAAMSAVNDDIAFGPCDQEDFTAAEDSSHCAAATQQYLPSPSGHPQQASRAQELASQSALIRDIFGNPFRPVAFDPAWRSEAAVGIASGIYEERAFERMPILADALQDAGCEHPDVLAHCREPGTHVRGCWVVDLVLGKE